MELHFLSLYNFHLLVSAIGNLTLVNTIMFQITCTLDVGFLWFTFYCKSYQNPKHVNPYSESLCKCLMHIFLLQSEYPSRSRRSADFDNSVFAEPRLSQYYGGDPQAVRRSFPELSISQPMKADVSPRLSKSQGNIKAVETSDFYAC